MVTFLTLLLGLTVGAKQVELSVDDRVASVELLLDGRTVAVLHGAPWTARCDFGGALVPHHLEAIARDGEGRELDRALQRINLPRAAAEATLGLLGGAAGYHAAELSWKAADDSDPEQILVLFDGEPLGVEGRRVTLPPHDRKAIHVLAAELVFPGQVVARAEAAFGGEYGEEVRSELTAVPLELDEGRRLPDSATVASWLRVDARPARVVAVERGPREVVVVREEASLSELRSLGRQAAGSGPRRGVSAQQQMSAGIDVRDTLRLVEPRPTWVRARDGGWAALFTVSPNLNGSRRGLGWTLTNVFRRAQREQLEEHINEAVAIAGLHAAGSNRVRAVLLVRAGDAASERSASAPAAGEAASRTARARQAGPADSVRGAVATAGAPASIGLEPENVRGFLRELRVPLFLWRLGPQRTLRDDGWGEATVVRGWGGVHLAVGEMMAVLRPQFLAWIDGLHRPGVVELTPDAPPGLRLAGAASVPRLVAAAERRR